MQSKLLRYGMGAPLAQHQAARRWPLLAGVALVICGGVLWLAAAGDPAHEWLVAVELLIGILVLGCMLAAIMTSRRLLLFEQGLVVRWGLWGRVYRWEQVESILWYVHFHQYGLMHIFQLRCDGAQPLDLEHQESVRSERLPQRGPVPNVPLPELMELMRELSAPRRLERLRARFEAGQTVSFGQMQVNQTGLTVREELLPWQNIDDLYSDGEVLIVKEHSLTAPRRELKIATLPNNDLLPTLIATTQQRSFAAFIQRDDSEPEEHAGDAEQPDPLVLAYLRHGRRRARRIVGVWALAIVALLSFSIWKASTDPRTYNRRATGLMEGNRYSQAIVELDRAIALDPSYQPSYRRRCQAHRESGHYEEALADCLRAIELDPGDHEAYVRLGRVYYLRAHYDQAVVEYLRALQIQPDFYHTHCNLGFAYKRMGLGQLAIEAFERCGAGADSAYWRKEAQYQIDQLR